MRNLDKDIFSNRYPGVKPFSEKEKPLFFGRESDLSNLESLLFIKQVVILYGKSGYGKSSLINAGIIPRLKQKGSCNYFSIRFNYYSEREAGQNFSPFATIKQRLAEKTSTSNNNPFKKMAFDENSLWYWIKMNQFENKNSKFIIFFDQFEELFSYPKEQIEEFSEQLSQLLYYAIPSKFRKQLGDLDESSLIPEEVYEILYEKPEIKVLFAIRSDRLSLINKLTDRHPTILQNCFELDSLDVIGATMAIVEPAKLPISLGFPTSSFDYTDDAVDEILKSIANPLDGKVDAATLQIICKYVEDTLVNERRNKTITKEKLGDITGIFQEYYNNVLLKLSSEEQLKARHLIEDELLEGGRRNPLPETYIQNKFGFTEKLLQQLEASSILRRERDAAGRILIELSHDALIAPVADARKKRLADEAQEKLYREREEKRKVESEIKFLEKARELNIIEKKGFQLNKSETLKRKHKLFVIQARLIATKRNIKYGIFIISLVLSFLFCFTWSIISIYNNKKTEKVNKKKSDLLEEAIQNLHTTLKSYDSIASPTSYRELKKILTQYDELIKP